MTKREEFEERKVVWLLAHPHFLVGRRDKHKIVMAMKHDGLVAKSTYWCDVKIDDAVKEAKIRWFRQHNGKPMRPPLPAPPRPARTIQDGLTMPNEVLELIKTRGVIAVFIPDDEHSIRFFVTQKLTQPEAAEFALILENCANTVRGMFRPTGGKVQ